MESTLEYIDCNICGENNSEKFDKIKSIFPEYLTGEYTLVRCKKCGLVYINPRPSKSILMSLYTSGDYCSRYQPYDMSRIDKDTETKGYTELLDNLENFIGKGRLLEIGMGYGLLLHAAKNRSWQVFGIETSTQQISFVKNQLNIDCSQNTFENMNFDENSFEAVVMDNVLEHMFDPKKILLKVNKILSNEGMVVIRVPNVYGFYCQISRYYNKIYDSPRKYKYRSERVSLQHMYEFSLKTLHKLLDITGFHISKEYTIQLNRFDPEGDRGSRKLAKKIINFLGAILPGWGDQCVVFAKKISVVG
jgi:2-polyprenyl-3-methyl-5-hydroxy-6-metoxy-1,4-benzoquinol methylase